MLRQLQHQKLSASSELRTCNNLYLLHVCRYHDIDDVPDFLIPAIHFCDSVCHPWDENMKFQSFIEGNWWTGKIVSREPFSAMYPRSLWQCFVVQWVCNPTLFICYVSSVCSLCSAHPSHYTVWLLNFVGFKVSLTDFLIHKKLLRFVCILDYIPQNIHPQNCLI